MLFCLVQVWILHATRKLFKIQNNVIFNLDFVAVDLQTQPSNDQQDSEGGCMC